MVFRVVFLAMAFLSVGCSGGPGPMLDENGKIIPFDRNGNPIGSSSAGNSPNTNQTDTTTDDSSDSSGDNPQNAPLTSVQAFQASLYPVLRNRCGVCHTTAQSPLFASANVQQAHDVIMNMTLVNFNSPGQSRLSTKIANGHQGINRAVATEISQAIIGWDTKKN